MEHLVKRLSPSAMKGAIRCPYGWVSGAQRLQMLPSDSVYADAGSAIHGAIAEYFQRVGDKPTQQVIRDVFSSVLDRYWTKYGLDDKKHLFNRKRSAITQFMNFEVHRLKTWKSYKPTMTESKLVVELRGTTFATIIDAYWEADGTILDWKSGKMAALTELDYLQGKIMQMVAIESGFKVKRVMFVALSNGLRLEMPNVDDEFVFSRVEQLKEFARNGYFPKKEGPHCRYCGNILRCQLNENNWFLWSEI